MNNNPFHDLGDIVMTPTIRNDDELIYEDTISESIENIVTEIVGIDNKFLNIVAIEDMSIHFLSHFCRALPYESSYSVSIMKDHNIINLSGKFDRSDKAITVFLHDGISLDMLNMQLRILSTMSYKYCSPIFVGLFNHPESDHSVIDITVKSFYGFGRATTSCEQNPYSIKYFL